MKETIKKKLFEDELLHLPFLKISLHHLFFTHRHRCGKIKRRKNKSRKTLLFLFKKKKLTDLKRLFAVSKTIIYGSSKLSLCTSLLLVVIVINAER